VFSVFASFKMPPILSRTQILRTRQKTLIGLNSIASVHFQLFANFTLHEIE